MKKLILLSTLTAHLLAGGHMDLAKETESTTQTEILPTQERTWYQVAMFKPETPLTDDELRNRVIYTNLIGAGVVLAWGTAFWDYFTVKPVLGDEKWFGADTKYGGADKLGHMYSTYLWSLGFSSLYEYWGMNEDDAMLYGPLTSWTFQFLMEIGDSFSETQGFAYEDLVMNTVGAAFYYVREKYPEVKRKVDLRLEYIPDFNAEVDFFTSNDNSSDSER